MGQVFSTNAGLSAPPNSAEASAVSRPDVFFVPANECEVLNFSSGSNSPESKLISHLISDAPTSNIVTVVGLGGTGKTTILCAVGRHPDVCTRFTDGVWYISLGENATVHALFLCLKSFVRKACDAEVYEEFIELTQDENTHVQAVVTVVHALRQKNVLLMFDDIWDTATKVYKLVKRIATEVRTCHPSLTLLMSARTRSVVHLSNSASTVYVEPRAAESEATLEIICRYADVELSCIENMSKTNRQALSAILAKCAGLPLTLAVAGSTVRSLMNDIDDASRKEDAWTDYSIDLIGSPNEIGRRGSTHHEHGVFESILSTLNVLENSWSTSSQISASDAFKSFCVLKKQTWTPIEVLRRLWRVDAQDADMKLKLYAQCNLVARVVRGATIGFCMHDLVHDFSVSLAEENKSTSYWHGVLLESYADGVQMEWCNGFGDSQIGIRPWWRISLATDSYLQENLARHLLAHSAINELLVVLVDFRWIQTANENTSWLAFEKSMSDLQLLADYLGENANDGAAVCINQDTGDIVRDIQCIIEVMEVSSALCTKNRTECAFQLYGRLSGVTPRSRIITRCLWSIEKFAIRPWVKPGPRVLRSVGSGLKKILPTPCPVGCMEFGPDESDLVVGGFNGELRVLDCHTGSVKVELIGHEEWITGVAVDRKSKHVISSSKDGSVRVWKGEEQLKEYYPFKDVPTRLPEPIQVSSMVFLPSQNCVACGSSEGVIRLLDCRTGQILTELMGHEYGVLSLATSSDGTTLFSGSHDNTVRRWDLASGQESGEPLHGHERGICSLSLSTDENYLASASLDGAVILWDVCSGSQLYSLPTGGQILSENNARFSRDGKYLFHGDKMESVAWDVLQAYEGVASKRPLACGMVGSRHMCLSTTPDGKEVWYGSDSCEIYVLRAPTFECSPEEHNSESDFGRSVSMFGVSPDGMTVAAVQRQGGVLRFGNGCGPTISDIMPRLTLPAHERLGGVAVSNNADLFGYKRKILDPDKAIYLVKRADEQLLCSLSSHEAWLRGRRELDGAKEYVHDHVESMHFSPNGGYLTAVFAFYSRSNARWRRRTWTWNVCENSSEFGLPLNRDGVELDVGSLLEAQRALRIGILPEVRGFSTDGRCVTLKSELGTILLGSFEDRFDPNTILTDGNRLWGITNSSDLRFVDLIDGTYEGDLDEGQNAPALPIFRQSSIQMSETDELRPYDVFISHAGPDKKTIAIPLYHMLQAAGLKCFLDIEELRVGDNAAQKMIDAMNTARIGIIILSPEYGARRWTMKELLCFQRRIEEAKANGEVGPVLIPVFYRLDLYQCKDPKLYDFMTDDGQSVFYREGFFSPERQRELKTEVAMASIRALTTITGIENIEGASNEDNGEVGRRARHGLVRRIAESVVQTHGKSGWEELRSQSSLAGRYAHPQVAQVL